jgi:hypothetical protein
MVISLCSDGNLFGSNIIAIKEVKEIMVAFLHKKVTANFQTYKNKKLTT